MDNLPISHEENALSLLDGMPSVEAVRELESHLLALPQVDLSTTHVIHGGMCARTIMIPAGNVLTGALTNCDNICILCGDITVTTDEGTKRLTGFNVLPASAGTKRAGVTHSDTWWSMVWRTDLTDIEAIEDELTDESAMLQSRRSSAKDTEDREDFAAFMAEYGLTAEFLKAVADYTEDHAPAPVGTDTLSKWPSKIHGYGLFATERYTAGWVIAPMRIDGMRTPAGRYINHSPNPNSEAVIQGDDLWCRALRDIEYGEEVTLNYRQVIQVNPILKGCEK